MSMDTANEKRHFQRIFYNADAQLSGENLQVSCKVLDISLKGCLLEFESPWKNKADDHYTLTLNLSDELNINMPLKYTHGSDTKVGFKCDQIDIDSMTNLRRLVELNLGDMDMLNRDLSALISS